MKIRLDVIELDPDNPKQEDRINRLKKSIKEIGQIEPVKLRILSANGKRHYAMVSGHHRFWAKKALGHKTIDAEIEGMSDDDMDTQRSVSAAFDNREDPAIVTARKMMATLGNYLTSTEDEIKSLSAIYGHKPKTIANYLAFARFEKGYVKTGLRTQMEKLGVDHFLRSGPLSGKPKDRADLLVRAAEEGFSSGIISAKAKSMKDSLDEAEEAERRKELAIAEQKRREAEAAKKSKGKDAKGRTKSAEATKAEAEATTRKKKQSKAREEDWELTPSQIDVINEIVAIPKKRVPIWKQVLAQGKFAPEHNQALVGHVDKAIEALQSFRESLLGGQ